MKTAACSFLMFIITMVIIMSLSTTVQGQIKRNSYRVQVEFFNGETAKGNLIALNDSSIQVVTFRDRNDTVFFAKDIRSLSVRRRNAPERGFAVGLGIGAAFGAAMGYVSYSPPSCDGGFCLDFGPEFSALGGALLGGLAGGLIGTAAGSVYTEYPIYGNRNAYHNFRHQLSEESASRYQRKLAKKRVPINDEVD